jgi:hypothetical protein
METPNLAAYSSENLSISSRTFLAQSVYNTMLALDWRDRVEQLISSNAQYVGVVPISLQDIDRASDGAKRRPVEAEGWAEA